MVSLRTLHAYVGMFIAPSVLFFATTGLLQIYSLHEAHAGYTPPVVIEELSAVHKDQRFAMDRHKGAPQPTANPAPGAQREAQHGGEVLRAGGARSTHMATAVLKAFFACVALGLIFSTLAGLWMALQQRIRRRTHLVLLVIGALVPLALIVLTAQ